MCKGLTIHKIAAVSPPLSEALNATVKDAPHPARFLLEDLK